MEKSYRKCAPKVRLDPFLILLNNPKQALNAGNYFVNKMFLKNDYKKSLKMSTLFFLSNPGPFNGQSY